MAGEMLGTEAVGNTTDSPDSCKLMLVPFVGGIEVTMVVCNCTELVVCVSEAVFSLLTTMDSVMHCLWSLVSRSVCCKWK